MARVLVLGAGGFIGAHVVRAFLRQGWQVMAGCRSPATVRRLDIDDPRLTRHAVDLTDLAQSDVWVGQIDVLINCAGYGVNPRETDGARAVAVNATALADLVARAAAASIGRIIHLGTAVEYGRHAGQIAEDAALSPAGSYANTKLAGSIIAVQAARAAGLDLCVVRPFGCYGAFESDDKFVPGLLAALRQGRSIDLSAGTQIRDYTFVGDIAEAIVTLADPGVAVSGCIFNICSGVAVSIRELGEALIRVVGADPALARWGALPWRPSDMPHLVGNPARLRALTGWQPRTTLPQGLEKTVEGRWF